MEGKMQLEGVLVEAEAESQRRSESRCVLRVFSPPFYPWFRQHRCARTIINIL
jgi:hypothetical protein